MMSSIECIGWAGVLFALGHILAAVGGAKVKSTVHLLLALSGGFILAAVVALFGALFGVGG